MSNKIINHVLISLLMASILSSCGGGSDTNPQIIDTAVPDGPLDIELRDLISAESLTGDASTNRNLPSINDPKAQLGKQLFFAKNLGGQQDSACVSCHHITLGGGDNLSLSVGVDAVNVNGVTDDDLLGLGRFHSTAGGLPTVPRNAPTVMNIGLWDVAMFWDSRVQSQTGTANVNGAAGGIITPDSVNSNSADATLPTAYTLAAAQARFPVTSAEEMRAQFLSGDTNQNLRAALSVRLDNEVLWQQAFTAAFGDSGIDFDRIAEALGEYERSMVFVDNPWKAYIEGDNTALTDEQKEGAILFYTSVGDNGAGCSRCHSGDFFTDEQHHIAAFPQIGPGKGNDSGNGSTADFGRENISGNIADRFHFRTPSLLNVAMTAPYGHAGAYQTLAQVVDHYDNPRAEVNDLFGALNGVPYAGNADLCNLPQIESILQVSGGLCQNVYPNAYADSIDAVDRLNDNGVRSSILPTPNLNGNESQAIVAFLQALTDPCLNDRTCMDPWIVDTDDIASFPDALPLIAHDRDGVAL